MQPCEAHEPISSQLYTPVRRFIVRSLLLAFAVMNTAAAQDESSRLRYSLPEGWTPALDGKTLFGRQVAQEQV